MHAFRHFLFLLAIAALALAACQPVQMLSLQVTPPPTHTPFAFSSLYGQQPIASYTPTAQPTPTFTPTPSFSGETFTLHLFCALSGPLPELAAARAAAFAAALAAQNAAGGVRAAQLGVQIVDTGEDAEAALQALPAAPMLAVFCDAASETALSESLRQQRIPAIGLGVQDTAGGRLFAIQAAPAEALSFTLQDLSVNWRQRQPLSAGSQLRLALLSWPLALSGNAFTAQVESYAATLDVEIAYQAELNPQLDLNVYDAVFAMRDAHANIVYINADSFGLAYVLNALNHLGLRSRVVVVAPAAAYVPLLYSYLADPAFADGLYLVSEGSLSTETWEQHTMQAALQVAVLTLDAAIEQAGSVAALSTASLSQALAALPSAGGLTLWQVGATPGELRQVSEATELP